MRLYWRFAASSSRRWLDLTLNEICVMFLIHLSTFCVLPAIFFMWPKLDGSEARLRSWSSVMPMKMGGIVFSESGVLSMKFQ